MPPTLSGSSAISLFAAGRDLLLKPPAPGLLDQDHPFLASAWPARGAPEPT